MSYHTDIAGTYEPNLVAIFEYLNNLIFNGELPLPAALAYDYRRVGNRKRRGRGGQIYYRYSDGHCYYIVTRGKLKGNSKFEELTLLHEMVHLSLIVQWFKTDLPDSNYRIQDFVTDKSSSFILECARVANKYGCSFNDLAKWDVANNLDQDTTLTAKSYSEINDAKALLGELS